MLNENTLFMIDNISININKNVRLPIWVRGSIKRKYNTHKVCAYFHIPRRQRPSLDRSPTRQDKEDVLMF